MPRPSNKVSPLALLRIKLRLSQQDFAALIGSSVRSLQEISSGRQGVSEDLANRICQETGVSYDWLTGRDPKAAMLDCLGRPYNCEFYSRWCKARETDSLPLTKADRAHLLGAISIRIGQILSAAISAIGQKRTWLYLSVLEQSAVRLRREFGSSHEFDDLTTARATEAAARPMHPLPPSRREKAAKAMKKDPAPYLLIREFQKRIDRSTRSENALRIMPDELDLRRAITALSQPSSTIGKYIRTRLRKKTRDALLDATGALQSEDQLRDLLTRDLNEVVEGKLIWNLKRFADVQLSDMTLERIGTATRKPKKRKGRSPLKGSVDIPREDPAEAKRSAALAREYLNLLLLQDAFPKLIQKEPARLAFPSGARLPAESNQDL